MCTRVSVHLRYIITVQLRAWVSRLLPPSFTGPGNPGGQRLPAYGTKAGRLGLAGVRGQRKAALATQAG